MGNICYEVHALESEPASFVLHKDLSGKKAGFYPNYHSEIEILYIASGSETVCADNEVYNAKSGDIVVINSGCIHTAKSANWKHHVLIPSNNFLKSFGLSLSLFRFEPLIHDDLLKSLFLEIIAESERPGEYADVLTRIAIERFLITLLRDYATIRVEQPQKGVSGSEYTITARVMNYLAAHFFENFPIDQISESLDITTPYMCHCVKQVTGKSIVDHLNMIRCRAAYHYLIHSDKKINEIASLCGFNGRSYFAKVYRQCMGVLPSEVDRTPLLHKKG